jgi:hypothetical protein
VDKNEEMKMIEDACANISDDDVCVNMIVKFVNGTEEHYVFPRQITDEDAHVMMNKIQEALDSKHLIMDLGSKIQIMPMSNILQIEVTPPPVKLPKNCIKGASLV